MATKKCVNGHLYDQSIYGDKCPFCPASSGATKINGDSQEYSERTRIVDGVDDPRPTEPMETIGDFGAEPRTVLRHASNNNTGETGVSDNRRLVGLLVSYSANPAGEVYKVYEGRTTIGRDRTCDIPFPKDGHMSSKHLLIQYIEARGTFRAQEFDQGSSNGSYVNGQVYVLGDVVDLKSGDVIVIGSTKFIFLAIPEF